MQLFPVSVAAVVLAVLTISAVRLVRAWRPRRRRRACWVCPRLRSRVLWVPRTT
ncbi:MAG: hypothetical protein ABSB59_07630 [Streptosporangiaceae bacterium]